MTKVLMSLASAALLAALAPSALAQGMGRGPVAAACGTEISRHCAQATHGGGQVRACLQSHRDELSSGCRQALDTTGYGRRWRSP